MRVAEPVTTVYSHPFERVLFDRTRHANPFFHLFEALWMLNGGNDVKTLDDFLKSFKQFSDDGETYHGAYGYRWRHWPDYTKHFAYVNEIDQLTRVVDMLTNDPTTRRAVIGMWDPSRDLGVSSKDIPCNDLIKVSIGPDERLNIVIFNRSNDVVWGCYGANAVHMSMLHEYLCGMTRRPCGTMTQISCDFHAYLEQPYDVNTFVPPDLWFRGESDPPYTDGEYERILLVTSPDTFDSELRSVMDTIRDMRSLRSLDSTLFHNSFFPLVVFPMHRAWEAYREKRYIEAMDILNAAHVQIGRQNDWIVGALDWILEEHHRRDMKNFQKSIAV